MVPFSLIFWISKDIFLGYHIIVIITESFVQILCRLIMFVDFSLTFQMVVQLLFQVSKIFVHLPDKIGACKESVLKKKKGFPKKKEKV